MNDGMKDFMKGGEQVPAALAQRTLSYLLICTNPGTTLIKFYSSNLMGALLTLAFCPQYGFGPLGGDNGLLHYVMHFGPVWCGLFCSFVFIAGANFFSLLCLKPNELKWISGRFLKVVTPWISFLFFIAMFLKVFAPSPPHHDTISYYLSWYVGALVLSLAMVKSIYIKFA